jgi:pimeloyl-ACP methyl ester carboxylesterase
VSTAPHMADGSQLPPLPLPEGVRSRYVPDVNGLRMHILEAGFERDRPLVLLLHGFPELAFSWRKVIAPLAAAGFHVVAPDQRGYGRTTGWDGDYDGDLRSFRMINLVRDVLALISALGYREAHAVIGHDFGSPVAACCALIRPDVFCRLVLMSAPFAGPPQRRSAPVPDINEALGKLDPPRKHYQWYYATREADRDMRECPQGLHAFLRAYYHYKSADWRDNKPYRLKAWSAEELAKMPTYYIMNANEGMAETVLPYMPPQAGIDACTWLSEDELAVYASEFARTGFQAGLQWYRCSLPGGISAELDLFSGRTIDVPSVFIAGRSDWGVYQVPGSFERMQRSVCTNMEAAHLVEGAGHWLQQERPRETVELLAPFLTRGTHASD